MSTIAVITIQGGGSFPRSAYAYEERTLYATLAAGQTLQGATYEWRIGDRIVNTGLVNFYTPDDADVGQLVTVTALVTTADGVIRHASGNGKTIVGLNDPGTGTLGIGIDAIGDGARFVAVDKVEDEDGRGPMSYQWFVDGKAIAGANGSEFTLAQAGGRMVSLHGTYTDALGRVTTVTSDQPPRHLDAPGTVAIAGTVAPNGTLRVNAADPDGIVASHYAWDVLDTQGNWTALTDATGPELALGTGAPVAVRSWFDYADAGGAVFQHTIVLGTEGADDLTATYGMGETIHAGGGNDVIRNAGNADGGAGLDTYIADWGLRLFTQVPGKPGTWRAESTLAESTSILANVERVLLRTHAVALDLDGNAGQAFRLYEAAFDRAADPVGLGFWISRLDQGLGLKAIAEAFVASPEFKTMYGANPANAEIVAKFYANILDRAPDPTGVAFWNHVLDTGAASVADVLLEFSESAENVAALVGAVQYGIHYTPYTGM